MFVLDASRTIAMCLDDEDPVAAGRTFDRLESEAAVAPSIWPSEVANGLRTAIQRGRLQHRDLARVRGLLGDLGVEIDHPPLGAVFGADLDLALEQNLSAYDAAYLALAMRRGLPLATSDSRLQAACLSVGVPVIG